MNYLRRRDVFGMAAGLSAAAQIGAGSSAPLGESIGESQLFLDDRWIEESARVQRVWCQAEILPRPVLEPETAWEGAQIIIFGTVLRLTDGWRMYYMTYNRPAPSQFCLATSSDGIHWERPKLGLYEFAGTRQNNIVWSPPDGMRQDGPTVCHDPSDSRAPFKMMYYGFGDDKRPQGEYVGFSQDGISWTHHPTPVLTSTGDRTNLLPGRDHNGKFVAFLRHRDMMKMHRARTIWRSESDDFLRWTEPELILRPGLGDAPNTELYGMVGFRYAGMYLGMLERWHGNPDVIDVQVAWSHDGRQWRREPSEPPFIAPAQDWNRGWNSCSNNAPIRVNNQLWFYFGGRSAAHARETPRSYGAVGLATTGLDQFASLRADYQEGYVVTKPMTWPGGDLVLTCTNTRYAEGHPSSGGGSLSVEIREENNTHVAGFAGDQRAEHNVVSPGAWQTRQRPVRWPGDRSLDELKGRRIRLVFFMKDSRLFSFRAEERTRT